MKQFARKIVVWVLGRQVKRLCVKNDITTIGVVGSIGKTSTKRAVAEAVSTVKKVRYQDGNYNDLVTVPLVFFGHSMPSLLNPFAWVRIMLANELQIRKTYPFEVVVLELGTDGPGQIAEFSQYVHLDIAIVTAITPEHMEYFDSLDDVAQEELSVVEFSDTVITNADLISETHSKRISGNSTYSISSESNVQATNISLTLQGSTVNVVSHSQPINLQLNAFSTAQVYSVLAVVSVWHQLKLPVEALQRACDEITPVPGRMQLLKGIRDSLIIDDSYNASPDAVSAALDTLYMLPDAYKIAVLGNMNELGSYSAQSHTEIGNYCDPTKLQEVVTIGPDANAYLAPAAQSKGCKVTTFESPYKAGDYIQSVLQPKSVVLIKGSQNRVFAEEAIKPLLLDPKDTVKLVRQSPYWQSVKHKQFGQTE